MLEELASDPIDQWSTVLVITLQHSIHRADMLCRSAMSRLLCTSKTVEAIIAQYCRGQMQLCFFSKDYPMCYIKGHQLLQLGMPACYLIKDASTVLCVGNWIAQHGQLVRDLVVEDKCNPSSRLQPLLLDCIAKALQEAAKHGPLQLQSVGFSSMKLQSFLWSTCRPEFCDSYACYGTSQFQAEWISRCWCVSAA